MKGLSFSEPMVKAWLAGNKTVTRRLINPQPRDLCSHSYQHPTGWWTFGDNTGRIWKPRYLPGETVYIKETWAVAAWRTGQVDLYYSDEKKPVAKNAPAQFITSLDADEHKWRPGKSKSPQYDPFRIRSPHFMPEWAARSHALIVSVRAERVQEITEEDAIREGIPDFRKLQSAAPNCDIAEAQSRLQWPQRMFQALWESLHPGSWDRNDWVWRIELEKTEGG